MTLRQPLLPGDSGAAIVQRGLGVDNQSQLPDLNSIAYAHAPGLEGGTLTEYWRILARRKGTLLVFTLLSTLAAFFFTRAQSPVYRARTLLEIESLNENFLNMRNVNPTTPEGNSQSPESNVRTQVAVLQSRPVLERMLQKSNLEKRLLAKRPQRKFPWSGTKAPVRESPLLLHDQALSIAEAALRVRPQTNTPLVEITFDSSDPNIAADGANSLASAFSEVSLENRWRSTQNTSEWLTRQLQDVKVKLEKSEDALQTYARVSGLTFLSGGAENTTSEERLKQLQVELSKAEADRVQTQSRYEQAAKAPAESLPEVVDNPTLREYQVQLTTLRRQLADLVSSYTSNYPKVVSLRSQIASLETALEKERGNTITRTQNEYESAVRREKLVSKDYWGVIAQMSQEADNISHYSLLKREVDTTRQLYDSMIQRVKEANLASAMKAPEIEIIESARPPQAPYKPIAMLNMGFGLLSGLFVGSVVIIQRARSNTSIQEPGETVFELKVPELGVIPAAVPSKRSHVRRLGDPANSGFHHHSELTPHKKTPSVVTESFRLTLTSILLSSNNGVRPRVIAFSSASANEGKTTVTSNLGIALARFSRRVLLIDGDLRKRRLHRVFEVDNTVGLHEALTGTSSPAVKETKVPNLFVLPSGQGTDGDLLFYTSKFRDLLEKLKTEFDMILIDTPPLLQVADARLICSQADATVLVIAQHTPRETALLVRQHLANDGSHLLGTILNKWDPKTSLHGYPNYPNYYKYYYAEEQGS
jgi:capsular exopolysaccharide synthesis family protein